MFNRLSAGDMKLRRTTCDFLKGELHYPGHLFSGKGTYPLPEKLQSIKNIPAPKSPKEVRQMSGLTGYY